MKPSKWRLAKKRIWRLRETVAAFREFLASLHNLQITAPIHVAIASYFGIPSSYSAKQAVMREVQRSVIDPATGSFPAPIRTSSQVASTDATLGRNGLKDQGAPGKRFSCGPLRMTQYAPATGRVWLTTATIAASPAPTRLGG